MRRIVPAGKAPVSSSSSVKASLKIIKLILKLKKNIRCGVRRRANQHPRIALVLLKQQSDCLHQGDGFARAGRAKQNVRARAVQAGDSGENGALLVVVELAPVGEAGAGQELALQAVVFLLGQLEMF